MPDVDRGEVRGRGAAGILSKHAIGGRRLGLPEAASAVQIHVYTPLRTLIALIQIIYIISSWVLYTQKYKTLHKGDMDADGELCSFVHRRPSRLECNIMNKFWFYRMVVFNIIAAGLLCAS